mgnify:CR=1 FL=1
MAKDRNMRNIESDLEFENRIRPQELSTFSGQDKIVDNLKVFIKAALMRGDSLDHVLLHGPPGLGKTTLANKINEKLGATIYAGKDYLRLEKNPSAAAEPSWFSSQLLSGDSSESLNIPLTIQYIQAIAPAAIINIPIQKLNINRKNPARRQSRQSISFRLKLAKVQAISNNANTPSNIPQSFHISVFTES